MINRRSVIATAAAAVIPVAGARAQVAPSGDPGRTYVLVHGAYGGGWVWRDVAPALAARGHQVLTPTLTGLGDRSHLLSRQITIDTHVEDLANTLRFGGVSDVILVGHSYGGMPVTGVADRMPGLIGHIVYLDALIPENGERAFDTLPPGLEAARMKVVLERGAGVALPPPAQSLLPAGPVRDWAQQRVRPQPVGTYDTPLRLARPAGADHPVTYIAFTGPANPAIEPSRQRARHKAGWHFEKMDTPHDTPLIYPARLVERLNQIV